MRGLGNRRPLWIAAVGLLLSGVLPSCKADDEWPSLSNVDYERIYTDVASMQAGQVSDPNYRHVLDIYWPNDQQPDPGVELPALLMLPGHGWAADEGHSVVGKHYTDYGFVLIVPRLQKADVTLGPQWPEPGHDAEWAFRWAQHHASILRIDPQRIIAMGGSAGAHLSAALATGQFPAPNLPADLVDERTKPGQARPAGTVLKIGAFDLSRDAVPSGGHESLTLEGAPGFPQQNIIGCDLVALPVPAECNRRIESASLTNPADEASIPNFPRTFMYHAENDTVAPWLTQSFRFGLWFCFPPRSANEFHWWSTPTGGHADGELEQERLDLFLGYWDEDTDPAKNITPDTGSWGVHTCGPVPPPGGAGGPGAAATANPLSATAPSASSATPGATSAALLAGTDLVSVNGTGTDSGSKASSAPVFSRDGTKVAFVSDASDLVANDTNGTSDVFVRDLATNTTSLVSLNSAGTASATGSSSGPVFSPDGTRIAFISDAANLVAADANARIDVFVRTLATNTTSLVSLNAAGTGSANGDSWRPAWSPNGTRVAFESWGNNFGSTDSDRPDITGDGIADYNEDVYVRTLALTTNHTKLVSVNASGIDRGDRRSTSPVYSPVDSTMIAFNSDASNLAAGVTDNVRTCSTPGGNKECLPRMDIYLRDIDAGTGGAGQTSLVSATATSATTSANGPSKDPVFSQDGSRVAFTSYGDNLAGGITDSRRQTSWKVQDGSTQTGPGHYLDQADVYVRDLAPGTNRLVSVTTSGSSSGDKISITPVFDPTNSSRIAFVSQATNLATGQPTNASAQVFLRDLSGSGTTTLVSQPTLGGNSGGRLAFSPDGARIAFVNMLMGTNTFNRDVYVRDLSKPLTDTTAVVLASPDSGGARTGSTSFGATFPATDPGGSGNATKLVFSSYAGNLGPNDTAKCRPNPDLTPSGPNSQCLDLYLRAL